MNVPENLSTKKEAKPLKHIIRVVIRETLAIIFWTYVLFKVFLFDIDTYLLTVLAPEALWIIKFKLLILLASSSIFWLFNPTSRVVFWSLYIFFYPFVVLFWKIPAFVVERKSWNLAFALINSVLSFLTSFKFDFFIGTIILISLVLIYNSSNVLLLIISVFAIVVILIIAYLRRFILIFKPTQIFQVHTKVFLGIRKYGAKSFELDDEIKNLPIAKLSSKQLEKRTENLQMSVLFNRVCLFIVTKLKEYQTSGLNIVSYVVTLLFLFVITVIIFCFIFFGLNKVDPTLFLVTKTPHLFYFLYFSFNNLFFNSIPEVSAAAPLSQTFVMFENLLSLVLVGIFIALFFSIKHQRHSDELSIVMDNIKSQGESMESFIKNEYKINTIDDAIKELEKVKSSFIKFIYQLTGYIK